MQKIQDKYRTKDGQTDFVFSFEEQSDCSWRAYIESPIAYRGRPEGAHETHRLSDGGRRFVCWSESIRSPADMKVIAAIWADCTQNYIKTGSFCDPNAN